LLYAKTLLQSDAPWAAPLRPSEGQSTRLAIAGSEQHLFSLALHWAQIVSVGGWRVFWCGLLLLSYQISIILISPPPFVCMLLSSNTSNLGAHMTLCSCERLKTPTRASRDNCTQTVGNEKPLL